MSWFYFCQCYSAQSQYLVEILGFSYRIINFLRSVLNDNNLFPINITIKKNIQITLDGECKRIIAFQLRTSMRNCDSPN